ncbi:hypothetical protein EUTSA_v10015953mg [Eutrema salsugineum]|uniref:F-box associated beta-propeller type 1 domain-containing protein n=1 Tax=Eutrema salsugineum TaxID=72664 RepID=V4NC29_EUTSA|nr:putative F-box/kelch-repeat protein At1g20790 [Eutrema salsugineum]ESQ43481.1 hypothetical protein EUTSA_v10015953mg [Eutrema salsugineum]
MDSLLFSILDEILFRLNPKSLALMRCTNRFMESHISDNSKFKSEYLSRFKSSLLHISRGGSRNLCFHPLGDFRLFQNNDALEKPCHILGYCSGLFLLLIDGCFCVTNPLTKKFRFLNRSEWVRPKCIGFTVDQIDQTTQGFKIVHITVHCTANPDEKMYEFKIYTVDFWRLSRTTITCLSSDLMTEMKPVYLNGTLHWLRKDGSIIAFNPGTEQARLIIPNKPHLEPGTKLLLGADDNHLTLISATIEVIYVFILESILIDPKWILARQIKNEAVKETITLSWDMVAYDGKCLVVRTMTNLEDDYRVVYGYDLRANKWGVVGSIPGWCDEPRDFYQYKPSWSSVIGLLDQNGPYPSLFSSVEGMMGLINRNM